MDCHQNLGHKHGYTQDDFHLLHLYVAINGSIKDEQNSIRDASPNMTDVAERVRKQSKNSIYLVQSV
jgi:hypothetical protein